jgi:TRAP-type C4-dicarboxylate transport system permease small subunit
MLSLAMLQILLRNLFRTGLVWIDPLLRHLVLWIGVTGAVVATGRLRHIQMDVIGRLLPPGPRLLVTRLTSLVAAGICAVIARGAWVYLGEEADFGSAGLLGIPSWALTSVLFLGFALMSARFAVRAFDTRVRLAEILAQRESPIAGEGRPHA